MFGQGRASDEVLSQEFGLSPKDQATKSLLLVRDKDGNVYRCEEMDFWSVMGGGVCEGKDR